MSASEATCRSISACSRCVQAVDRVQVRRVGQGDGEAVVVLEDRHDAVFAGDVPRDGGDDVVVDLQLAEVDDLRAEMRGLGLGDIGRADHLVGHHQVHHAHAGGLGFPPQSRPPCRGRQSPGPPGYLPDNRLFQPRSILHYTRLSWKANCKSSELRGNVNAGKGNRQKRITGRHGARVFRSRTSSVRRL